MSTSIFRKNNNRPPKAVVRTMLPPEMLLETYENRPQSAEFDRIDLVIDLRPGKDEVGAVVKVEYSIISKCLFGILLFLDEIFFRASLTLSQNMMK